MHMDEARRIKYITIPNADCLRWLHFIREHTASVTVTLLEQISAKLHPCSEEPVTARADVTNLNQTTRSCTLSNKE